MSEYIRRVNYYETDKMGITHHSNYIRFMEEARIDFLDKLSYSMKRLEAEGVVSPVVALDCQYKHPSTFDDVLRISVEIEKYTGVKLILRYVMTDTATDNVVLTASSTHCFVDAKGKPISVKKNFPRFDEKLRSTMNTEE